MSSAATSVVESESTSSTSVVAHRHPRPTLRVLEGPVERVRRIPFLVSCIALLCLGLLALLGLNIGLARGSYEVSMLQKQQQQLTETTQNLNEQLDSVSSPVMLSSRARALGMVPSGAPVFIQLSDGRILGDPKVPSNQDDPGSVDLASPVPSDSSSSSGSAPAGPQVYPTYRTPGPAASPTQDGATPVSAATSGAPTSSTAAAGSTAPATSAGGAPATPTPSATGSTQPASAGTATSGN